MSILDDENILVGQLKENLDNPFFTLKQIFIQANKGNYKNLHAYSEDVYRILNGIKIPKHTKWFINYDIIELVDKSYYGEPGDYYKIFASISFTHHGQRTLINIKSSRKYTNPDIYNNICNAFINPKYDLVQITNSTYVYL